MDVHGELDYKGALRSRIKERSASGKPTTLKQLAERIPVQYTYLSRVLKGDEKHLSDDHLFTLCGLLEFTPEEIDYLMLLRAEITTTQAARKKYLQARLAHLRETKKLKASMKTFDGQAFYKDTEYLFEPLCVVVHISLGIEEFQASPHKLCSSLGISRTRLKEILRKLRDLEMIEMESDGKITKVNRAHFHYSPQHPLMRAHQNFLRTLSLSHLSKSDEEDRDSFMVTFSADASTFHFIKDSFRKFLQGIEKKVVESKNSATYQMNFDLFKWL